jgi:hypothetical protein
LYIAIKKLCKVKNKNKNCRNHHRLNLHRGNGNRNMITIFDENTHGNGPMISDEHSLFSL